MLFVQTQSLEELHVQHPCHRSWCCTCVQTQSCHRSLSSPCHRSFSCSNPSWLCNQSHHSESRASWRRRLPGLQCLKSIVCVSWVCLCMFCFLMELSLKNVVLRHTLLTCRSLQLWCWSAKNKNSFRVIQTSRIFWRVGTIIARPGARHTTLRKLRCCVGDERISFQLTATNRENDFGFPSLLLFFLCLNCRLISIPTILWIFPIWPV